MMAAMSWTVSLSKLSGNMWNIYTSATKWHAVLPEFGRLVQALEWFEPAFEERDSCLAVLKSLPLFGIARFIPGVRKPVRRMRFPYPQ